MTPKMPRKTLPPTPSPGALPALCKDFEDVPMAGPVCPGGSGAVCSFICFPDREGSDLVGFTDRGRSGTHAVENVEQGMFTFFHEKTMYKWM